MSEDLEIIDCNSSNILIKGSLGSIHRRPHCVARRYHGTSIILFSVGDNNRAGIYGTASFFDGLIEIDGATNAVVVDCPVGNTLTAFTGFEIRLLSGSLAANPFRVNGVNYPTFAAFNAAFPGNTANFA